jgi:hypothetical protein
MLKGLEMLQTVSVCVSGKPAYLPPIRSLLAVHCRKRGGEDEIKAGQQVKHYAKRRGVATDMAAKSNGIGGKVY